MDHGKIAYLPKMKVINQLKIKKVIGLSLNKGQTLWLIEVLEKGLLGIIR